MNQELNKLEASLAHATTLIDRVNAQNGLAEYLGKSDTRRSLEMAIAAESLARQAAYPQGLVIALRNQAQNYRKLGDHATALRVSNNARLVLDEIDFASEAAVVARTMGFIYSDLGDYAKALKCHINALSLYEETKNLSQQANSLVSIGMLHSLIGDSKQAIGYYARAIESYSSLDDPFHQAIAFNSCCVDYTKLGDYERAKDYGEKARQTFIQLENQYGIGVAWGSLGEVALAQQDFKTAISHFEQALSLFKVQSPELTSQEALETQLNLAKAHHHTGNADKALEYTQTVLKHAEKEGVQHFVMQSLQQLSQICESKADTASALNYLKRYIEVREKILSDNNQREIRNLRIVHETQQAQAESERQKKLRELDRTNFERITQIKDEFLAHATHDIKGPLAIVNTATFLLKSRLPANDELGADYLNLINNSGQQIRQLVEDILELAKLEATPALQLEAVALDTWLNGILHKFKTLAEVKQITISCDVQPLDLVCRCNKQRFSQALENLLSNAIKYTQNGGKVSLSASIAGTGVQVQVSDNGIGIPEEALPKLFDRFYRVNNSLTDTVEGTGLGLSIVKLSIEQHKGTINVKSTVGQGTTFTIQLPL